MLPEQVSPHLSWVKTPPGLTHIPLFSDILESISSFHFIPLLLDLGNHLLRYFVFNKNSRSLLPNL